MIPKKVQDAFNAQIREEQESAQIYLSMAAWFSSAALDGMAQWMRVQVGEETAHAMRFFDHVHERDGKVELSALAKPKVKWTSPLDAFKDALKHEKYITGKINSLVKLADAEKDYASLNFLQWFVKEQVEEEASVLKVVQVLERIGDAGPGIIMLDVQLGKRGS